MESAALHSAKKAQTGLLNLQKKNGRFEGKLTSNAYPTLACMLIDMREGLPLDAESRRWLIERQGQDGLYPLDPEGRASEEAARFARVVLQAALEIEEDEGLRQALETIPPLGWDLWLVKTFGALAGQYEWDRLIPPWHMSLAGRVLGGLSLVFPKALFRRIKPPQHIAPPVSLHRQGAFKRLFAAEQYTLAPMLLLIEAHTRRRPQEMKDLTSWVLSRQAADGSWFCVAFITAIAALALQAAQRANVDERIELPLKRALEWLDKMRNPDGGRREAASLNVWDTSLAVQALVQSGVPARAEPIQKARQWLEQVQNMDGGWAFHGLRGRGLPSDADDTALAAAALMTRRENTLPIQRAIDWLRERQAADGSWATYSPGAGDVGCVSVTAHALETAHKAGETQAVKKAVEWLHDAQNADGSWDDLWIAKKSYGTGAALTAMARTGLGDAARIRRGLEWLQSAQNADGGWGETQQGEPTDSSAEQTAAAAQALRAHGESNSKAGEAAVQWLLKRQREDGGWDPSPVGIYWEVIGGYANPMNAWVFPLLALTEAVEPVAPVSENRPEAGGA